MKSMLRQVQDGDLRYEALMFWCPGCESTMQTGGLHMLPVKGDSGNRPRWDFDPSILTRAHPAWVIE